MDRALFHSAISALTSRPPPPFRNVIKGFVERNSPADLPEHLFTCFFSSRRLQTCLQGDWSSDVCSSDLERSVHRRGRALVLQQRLVSGADDRAPRRSEERRVGKECRSRGSPNQQKKK